MVPVVTPTVMRGDSCADMVESCASAGSARNRLRMMNRQVIDDPVTDTQRTVIAAPRQRQSPLTFLCGALAPAPVQHGVAPQGGVRMFPMLCPRSGTRLPNERSAHRALRSAHRAPRLLV